MADPLTELSAAGVSVWLDDLSRLRLTTGTLRRLVRDRHVMGVTSNPTIFATAIGGSDAYDDEIADLARRGVGADESLRMLTTADARLAYQQYDQAFATTRAAALTASGAHPQRPLWASTGVKDPSYDDTRYVIELVADGVVNTMPEATMNAVATHGVIRGDTIRPFYPHARQVLHDLAAAGIDYDDVVRVLEDEGAEKFEASWALATTQLTGRLRAAPDNRPQSPSNAHPSAQKAGLR